LLQKYESLLHFLDLLQTQQDTVCKLLLRLSQHCTHWVRKALQPVLHLLLLLLPPVNLLLLLPPAHLLLLLLPLQAELQQPLPYAAARNRGH
jgi:hypothetical protein